MAHTELVHFLFSMPVVYRPHSMCFLVSPTQVKVVRGLYKTLCPDYVPLQLYMQHMCSRKLVNVNVP